MGRTILPLALGAVLAMAPPQGAFADRLTLRVADSLPAAHFFTREATEFWMSEVGRLTDGRVRFEHFPAGQLGGAGDLLSLTQSGAVDIGYVVPSYTADRMPLTAVAELPGTFSTSCEGTLAYWQLAQEGGALFQHQYGPAGVRILFAVVMPPYQAFLRGPLAGIDDLVGQKLRTSSAGQDAIARRLDAVPIRITAPEVYGALSRGTIDGLIFPTSSVLAWDLGGLVASATSGANFGSAVLTVMISQARWDSLPAEVQAAMAEAGEATTRRICAYTDDVIEADSATLEGMGVRFVTPEGEFRARLDAEMLAARQEWAEQVDAMNMPGSAVLAAFEATMTGN